MRVGLGGGWAAIVVAGLAVNLVMMGVSWRKRYGDAELGRLYSRADTVRGLRMHALQSAGLHGRKTSPVVLVHGLGASSRYLVPIGRHLAPHLPVFAPDLPGFGKSDKPRRVLSIPELADTLAAWMEVVGLKRASFIGNSMGCEILVELALRHPERIRRMVLQGPTPDPSARSAGRQAWRLVATSRHERSPLVWVLALDYARCGVWRYLRNFRDILNDRIEDKLPRVDVPTLVVRGTRDRVVSQEWADRAARLLPDGRLAVIRGAAHAINFSYPDELRQVVLPFLLEHGAAPGRRTVADRFRLGPSGA